MFCGPLTQAEGISFILRSSGGHFMPTRLLPPGGPPLLPKSEPQDSLFLTAEGLFLFLRFGSCGLREGGQDYYFIAERRARRIGALLVVFGAALMALAGVPGGGPW